MTTFMRRTSLLAGFLAGAVLASVAAPAVASAVTQPTVVTVSGVVTYPGATMGGTVSVSNCQTALGAATVTSAIAENGAYSLQLAAGCTGGTFSVRATSSAHELTFSVATGAVFDAGTTDQVIDITMPTTVPLTVTVTDTGSVPLSGAFVDLTASSAWPTSAVTLTGGITATAGYELPARRKRAAGLTLTTGTDGTAVVQLPANSTSNLVANYTLAGGLVVIGTPVAASVDGSGGSASITLDITGPQYVTVSGRVTAPSGQAIAGSVAVRNCTSSWGASNGSSLIAADGSYSFPLIANCTGGSWLLTATSDLAPSLVYSVSATGFAAPASDLVIEDIAFPGSPDSITVDVVDTSGNSVPGATVDVDPPAAGWPTSTAPLTGTLSGVAGYVSTDSRQTDGTNPLTFPVPSATTSDVTASILLSNGQRARAVQSGVASGGTVTLTLDTTVPVFDYVTVSGTVTQDGAAAFNGAVRVNSCMASQVATSASAPIEADGSFSLSVVAGCTGGALLVDAQPNDPSDLPVYLTTGYTFDAPANGAQVSIDVPATVPLSIKVTEASGAAVEAASVFVRPASWPVYTAAASGTTLQGGYYFPGRRNSRSGTTDASGDFNVRVPANATSDVYASIGLLGGLRAAGAVYAAPSGSTGAQVTVPLTGAEVLSAGASTGAIGITTQEGSVQGATSEPTAEFSVPPGATDLTGTLSYNITGLTPGSTADVSFALPEGSSTATAIYKNVNGTWVDLSSAASFDFDNLVVTLTITDGGLGDSDGIANGTIVDPVILANVDDATLATLRATKPSAPAAPTTTPTGTGISLQWKTPPSSWNLITGYEVQVATKATGPFSRVTSGTCAGTVSSTSCTATLSGGKTYYFQVRAQSAAGLGPWSTTSAGATTSLAAALKPTFGTVTKTSTGFTVNVTNYNPAFTWSSVTTAGTVTQGTASGSVLPLTVSGLTAGQAATVTVTTSRTGYATGSASISSAAQASVPSSPRNVTATPGTRQVSVSWTAPESTGGSAITKYTATAWTAASGGTAAGTCSPSRGAVTCTISKLTTNATYYVDVTATNAVGTSQPSARVPVTVR